MQVDGSLQYNGPSPNKLKYVELTNYDSSACKNVSPNATKNWQNQICAG